MADDLVENAMAIYAPALGAAELREQSALLRAEASAGSLVLMLDDIVQRLSLVVWVRKTHMLWR